MGKPLDGVRVVDLSQLTSGPLATMVLAEQGADVVKVEPPGLGDIFRLSAFSRGGFSALLLNHNRGKRGICIDTATDEGRDLVDRADGGRRRRRAELPAGRGRPARLRLRRHQGSQPAGDLRVDQRLRPHRPLRQPAGGRPDHPGPHRHRRSAAERGDPAARPRPQHHRRQGHRPHRGAGDQRGAVPPRAHRRGRPPRDPDARRRRLLLLARRDDGLHAARRRRSPAGRASPTPTRSPSAPTVSSSTTRPPTTCGCALYRVLGHPELCDDPRFNDIHGLMADDNFVDPRRHPRRRRSSSGPSTSWSPTSSRPGSRWRASSSPTRCSRTSRSSTTAPSSPGSTRRPARLRQPRHPVRFASAETPVPESVPGLGEHTDEILAELGRTAEQIAALRERGGAVV